MESLNHHICTQFLLTLQKIVGLTKIYHTSKKDFLLPLNAHFCLYDDDFFTSKNHHDNIYQGEKQLATVHLPFQDQVICCTSEEKKLSYNFIIYRFVIYQDHLSHLLKKASYSVSCLQQPPGGKKIMMC